MVFFLLAWHCGACWLFSSGTDVFCRFFFFYWIFFSDISLRNIFYLQIATSFFFRTSRVKEIGMKIKIIYIYINLYIWSIILLVWKNTDCTIRKFYILISGEKISKKKRKTLVLLENDQVARMSSQKKKKKTSTEIPKLKCNKTLNTWDRANIMKIIPTWPRASLPRFHLNGSSGSHWRICWPSGLILSLTYSWAGFHPSFKCPTCLATLKSCDTTKQSVSG